eukprot:106923-Chlamydomonas_euryale.AAC.2
MPCLHAEAQSGHSTTFAAACRHMPCDSSRLQSMQSKLNPPFTVQHPDTFIHTTTITTLYNALPRDRLKP